MVGKGKVCGSGDVQVAGMWEKEGVGLRVLKNGDGEGSPSLVLGVGEKEREMGPREELSEEKRSHHTRLPEAGGDAFEGVFCGLPPVGTRGRVGAAGGEDRGEPSPQSSLEKEKSCCSSSKSIATKASSSEQFSIVIVSTSLEPELISMMVGRTSRQEGLSFDGDKGEWSEEDAQGLTS
ncbi:hypothetical protein D5086_005892 [Populus alba]|uniref:Uncharacterized protein n=1 Tax=Populus alba TaxID=43335 RepID=A0ACC4CW47_POPAL